MTTDIDQPEYLTIKIHPRYAEFVPSWQEFFDDVRNVGCAFHKDNPDLFILAALGNGKAINSKWLDDETEDEIMYHLKKTYKQHTI